VSVYSATVVWERREEMFVDRRYCRAHLWQFDGGAEIPASASPRVVPVPLSVEAYVDPEEAFVAAIASCHMLFFLDLCAQRGYVVDSYEDQAIGRLEMNEDEKPAMTEVMLRPRVAFSGDSRPTAQQLDQLHHQAHELCFIANSVRTRVTVEHG